MFNDKTKTETKTDKSGGAYNLTSLFYYIIFTAMSFIIIIQQLCK